MDIIPVIVVVFVLVNSLVVVWQRQSPLCNIAVATTTTIPRSGRNIMLPPPPPDLVS